jgi:hypothetical protein
MSGISNFNRAQVIFNAFQAFCLLIPACLF